MVLLDSIVEVACSQNLAPIECSESPERFFDYDDIDAVVARLRAHGADQVGAVVQYEATSRLCYVRGPEGITVGLAEQRG